MSIRPSARGVVESLIASCLFAIPGLLVKNLGYEAMGLLTIGLGVGLGLGFGIGFFAARNLPRFARSTLAPLESRPETSAEIDDPAKAKEPDIRAQTVTKRPSSSSVATVLLQVIGIPLAMLGTVYLVGKFAYMKGSSSERERMGYGIPTVPQPEVFTFSKRPPFPSPFEAVVPGMRLTDVRAAYPGGRHTTSEYDLWYDTGPFTFVSYSLHPGHNDPTISSIRFSFCDAAAHDVALREALRRFGTIPHESESMGLTYRWPQLFGFQLTIDENSMSIRAAAAPVSSGNEGGEPSDTPPP